MISQKAIIGLVFGYRFRSCLFITASTAAASLQLQPAAWLRARRTSLHNSATTSATAACSASMAAFTAFLMRGLPPSSRERRHLPRPPGLLLLFDEHALRYPRAVRHGFEHHGNRLGIVICSNVINVGRITTSIYHCKYGDAQAFCLLTALASFTSSTTDEQGGRQRVRSAIEPRFFSSFARWRKSGASHAWRSYQRAGFVHLVDEAIFLTALRMVGSLSAYRPPLCDVRHTDGCHLSATISLVCFFVAANSTRRPLLAICLMVAASI